MSKRWKDGELLDGIMAQFVGHSAEWERVGVQDRATHRRVHRLSRLAAGRFKEEVLVAEGWTLDDWKRYATNVSSNRSGVGNANSSTRFRTHLRRAIRRMEPTAPR